MIQSLPIGRLTIGPDHVPGMDLIHLTDLVHGDLVDDRPLDVARVPGGFYQIRNGRHRFLRAVIVGERFIDCEVE